MSVEFKIGADPEFFLLDKETGKHVSAHGMIKGDKANPQKVEGGAVQVDGMALEFNIDPVNTAEEFVSSIQLVLGQLREMIDERYEFSFVPVAHFGKEYIDAQPKKAKELGCDPDYNAYTGEPNPVPNGDLGFRTASGHIHIGWTEGMSVTDPGHFEAARMLTKQFDYSLAVGALLWDRDRTRAEMYGKPGAFRPKPYGMEYRVLSNAWVNDPELCYVVAANALREAKRLLKGEKTYYYDSNDSAINNMISSIVEGRWNLNDAYNHLHLYPDGFHARYAYNTELERYRMFSEPVLTDEEWRVYEERRKTFILKAFKKKNLTNMDIAWIDDVVMNGI